MGIITARGEISARLDGREWKMCLTLGSLAMLEERLGAANLSQLGETFAKGSLNSEQIALILTAGLIGAGHEVTEQQVAAMHCEDGISGYIDIAARLLEAAFCIEGDEQAS